MSDALAATRRQASGSDSMPEAWTAAISPAARDPNLKTTLWVTAFPIRTISEETVDSRPGRGRFKLLRLLRLLR